jgi:hypothetical protein
VGVASIAHTPADHPAGRRTHRASRPGHALALPRMSESWIEEGS